MQSFQISTWQILAPNRDKCCPERYRSFNSKAALFGRDVLLKYGAAQEAEDEGKESAEKHPEHTPDVTVERVHKSAAAKA